MRNGPDYIQFYPTLRCNRSCDFCFNRSLPAVQDMTYEAFRAMLDRLKGFSVKAVDIIGGEPTMHPDIIRFTSQAVGSGFHVNLSSNGTNARVLEEILKTGDNVGIGVSINEKKTFNHLRGFIQKNHPIVKTIFTPFADPALIADILSLKPEKFYMIYRDAMSRAELEETIPFPQFMKAVRTMFDSREAGMVYCSGFIPDAACPELSNVRCPAGTTKLGVMPDGAVYPCNLFFGRAGFLLGNILVDPFETIWSHPALTFFRTYAHNHCPQSSCELHARCHGGCPAQAFHLSGNLAAPDPRCIRMTASGINLL
jgi:radical SAM protein with 4Fe4S-binding SPASM domain